MADRPRGMEFAQKICPRGRSFDALKPYAQDMIRGMVTYQIDSCIVHLNYPSLFSFVTMAEVFICHISFLGFLAIKLHNRLP